MLNKDNNITLGSKKKRRIKATIYNFLTDFTSQKYWSTIDVQTLQGTLAYFNKIETEYCAYITQKYSNEFKQDLSQAIKTLLNPNTPQF